VRCQDFSKQIDTSARGIWKFRRFFVKEIPAQFRLSVGEGETPLSFLQLGKQKIWLKREDLNPHGSHKDRSLAYQISLAAARGDREVVISSSGNAALAAAVFCRLARIKLWALVSPDIIRAKFLLIKEQGAEIILSRRAGRLANYLATKRGLVNLRPSLAAASIEGFQTIGWELFATLEKPLPIFTFVTSGSSFLGIYKAWKKLAERKCIDKIPPLNAVVAESPAAAGRGGVRRSRRWPEITAALTDSGGQKYIVTAAAITAARKILADHKVDCSAEGVAAVAAAQQSGVAAAVVIISGRNYPEVKLQLSDSADVPTAAALSDIDKIISK
jgi:threonine synthase